MVMLVDITHFTEISQKTGNFVPIVTLPTGQKDVEVFLGFLRLWIHLVPGSTAPSFTTPGFSGSQIPP